MVGAVPVSAAEQPEEVTLYEADDYIVETEVQQETYAEAASLSSTSSAATSGVCGDNLTWVFDEATGTLTISGTGEMWNWTDGNNAPWYDLRTYTESVIIEPGVTSIGDYAFKYSWMKSIDLPEGIIDIGEYAFYQSQLKSIVIPDGVKTIWHYAFYHCSSLTSVTIPPSVTGIGKWAFSLCPKLYDVYIFDVPSWCKISFYDSNSNPVKSAGNLYIDGKKPTELVVPEEVKEIKAYTFSGWSSLINIVIPEGITKIGASAFSDCLNAVNISIPSSVQSIGEGAFRGCDSLKSIVIPNGITEIADSLCSGCDSLTDVIIPDGVTNIGYCSFYRCNSLTRIVIPASVKYIDMSAFEDCENLTGAYFYGSAPLSIADGRHLYPSFELNTTLYYIPANTDGLRDLHMMTKIILGMTTK